jgi:methyl-accepting chemotaxis protein
MGIKSHFQNLKLMGKLLLGFFTIGMTTTLLVGYFGLGGLADFIDVTEKMSDVRLPAVQSSLSLKADISEIKSAERTLIVQNLSREERNIQYNKLETAFNDFNQNCKIYQALPKSNSSETQWAEFTVQSDMLRSQSDKFISMSKEFDRQVNANSSQLYSELKKLSLRDLNDSFNKIESISNQIIETNIKFAESGKSETLGLISKTKISIIIATGIGLIFAAWFSMFISKNVIKRPFHELISVFNNVISGDLRKTIDVKSNDEIGILSQYLNKLIESQRQQINKIFDNTKSVTESSQKLFEISKKTAVASDNLLSQSNTAAASSEQISSNLNTVSSASEEVSSSITEISSNSNSAFRLTEEANSKANVASEVMNRLGTSSAEIGNIIKVITTISEQTNLLALNATIEAARAGETGKGFAVVANEVKELAKETSKATDDITGRIKTIQSETSDAINVITQIIESTKQVSNITGAIAASVEQHTITTNEINRNLTEASRGAALIAKTNAGIAQGADEYALLSSQVEVAASDLKKSADDLESKLRDEYKL